MIDRRWWMGSCARRCALLAILALCLCSGGCGFLLDEFWTG